MKSYLYSNKRIYDIITPMVLQQSGAVYRQRPLGAEAAIENIRIYERNSDEPRAGYGGRPSTMFDRNIGSNEKIKRMENTVYRVELEMTKKPGQKDAEYRHYYLFINAMKELDLLEIANAEERTVVEKTCCDFLRTHEHLHTSQLLQRITLALL